MASLNVSHCIGRNNKSSLLPTSHLNHLPSPTHCHSCAQPLPVPFHPPHTSCTMAATTIISDPDTDDEAVPEDERFYFFCIASHQVMSKVSRRVKRKEVTFGHLRRGLEGTIDAEFKFALSAKCNLVVRTGPSLTCCRGGGAAHCISQQFSIMPQMQHTSTPGNSTKTISDGLMEAAIKHVKVLARMGHGQSCKFISSVKWRMGILIC